MNLGYLNPLLHRPGPWASVYLGTSEVTEDAERVQELEVRGACDQLADLGADDATCRAVYAELSRATRDDAGRAVFATDGEVVMHIPLSAPPPAPPLANWGVLPRLGPLLDYGERDPTCLVAYVDRRGADLELRGTHGKPRPAGEVTGREWPMHRTGRADWSQRHFQLAVENTWQENAARIAETLATDAARAHAELLVLAGDRRERREVRERLPEGLQARTVESDYSGRAAGTKSERLDAEVEQARHERTREQTEEAMDRFRAGRIPAHDRIDAAEGVPALVDAAREHRIAELLMRPGGPDLHRDVWVGPEPDQLALRRSESQYLGEPLPSAARADDALLRSAVATGAEVVPLPATGDGPRQMPVGGLGALLRWPYGGTVPGGGARPER
ncbi:baeRF2 domain-containing protein [Streptomyces litchfieldiae]|uniref:Vms1/Ankzf1 family peptidyl-tRNA hydrolase n=1 Tax=Streptomyces litchfieldiae TaxID=3075543 RepID=A0ABU2MRI5_9ACTN|nr:Vms1/Ankzf1 family peptidyl-tRNA hydrolase [Streptomyces sp. DSM 44938]MDT0344227.1 Vms1/Ankzf1 family peptidyl-tRNA hydrolase [Streptomyces sp. DSM 44938]